MSKNALLRRLENGDSVVVAEGYIFEFERRGYLKAGTFVPEVLVEHPELVRIMYEEFVHAGSDVVLAFTYYAHSEKLKLIGREDELEAMNSTALKLAREVADKHGCLMAGNICNTTAYFHGDSNSYKKVELIFKEQIELAVKYGADYIVGETFGHIGEAVIALDAIKKHGKGLPAVITMSPPPGDIFIDGLGIVEGCKQLEDAGAAVVGLNCGRGPATMLPLLKQLKDVLTVPIAALPVVYRTTPEHPTFFALKVPGTDRQAFPLDLTALVCSRTEVAEFAAACRDLDIQYVGLCCGNSANMTRIVAETYCREPPASRYSPEMEKHFIFGDKTKFHDAYTDKLRKHITGEKS